jgi:type III restriction enzyme
MAFELKDYQKKALGTPDTIGALETFFIEARGARDGAALHLAFNKARRAAMGENLRDIPYRPLAKEGDEGNSVPQVCIRIPTGGGKTLMAAHAIDRAARHYVGTSVPVVLWLVPTNTIRIQTRDALLTPGHPYREALLAYWPADRLAVLDIADCTQLRAQDFGNKAIIVVGTRQTLQVQNTASRDVYAYKEDFEPHFSAIANEPYLERVSQADLDANPSLRALTGTSGLDKVKRSFANLLAYHRPIVIVDEAHNARSDLSYEVFRRIRPSCIIEWTATPARDQNVLYHVSAQELKAEHMIKLPIQLSPHPNWQEAVRDAILTRERLAEVALGEAEYVRPIALFQADAVNGEVPVETLKQHLMTAHGIDERRIAVATGTQRGLDGVDLFDRACRIDFVITVEALKEGWDCSFAYVFCTVQNIRSAKDMEQLLGRVLRLPYARQRKADVLNRAYAHVCGQSTAAVANQLADRLVAMGFEEMEAASFIQTTQNDLFNGGAPTPQPVAPPATAINVSPAVASILQTAMPDHAHAAPTAGTLTSPDARLSTVTLSGLIPASAIEAALSAAPRQEREELNRLLERHQTRTLAATAPSQRGVPFAALPQLAIPVQGELLLLEPALLTELAEVALANAPADLPDFSQQSDEKPYLIDIERGQLRIEQDRSQYGLDLNSGNDAIRREDIIRELDRRVRRDDILQPDMIAWLGRTLDGILARGIELNYLARHINQLADAIGRRIDLLVKEQRSNVFQRCLIDGPQKVSLADFHQFRFDPSNYPARWLFNGRYNFLKHYYPRPGELDDDIMQEETACAIELDSLDQVKHWVRNLERQPSYSFWLPTSTDRFYPDFVAELDDGRLFVVEYKGAGYYTTADSQEKRDIGSVWAAASEGRCVFVMVTHPSIAGMSVSAQLRRAIKG